MSSKTNIESPNDVKNDATRDKWSSKIDFILSVVGLCVGLGNVWRFPYLCYENGGGVFLIPYILTLILAGVPVLLLELSVGQMKTVGVLGIWKLCPGFKGVGYAAIIMAFWLSIYYIVILAYALVYLFNSLTIRPLAWSHCNNAWNSINCIIDVNLAKCNGNKSSKLSNNTQKRTNCGNMTEMNTPIVEFWERYVLGESKGIDQPGHIKWQLALSLCIVWILCYFCIWKGVKWTGKIVYFTALFPYVLLICLFVRGLTLPGSAQGIEFYLKPNITKLKESKVWLDGATQIFFSYGLGLGTHIALGSYNHYKNNCHRDALIVSVVNSSTSIFAGFVVFSVLGFMASQQNKSVREVARSGQGLIFLAYPAALAQLPGAAIWSALFFLMIIFIGLDSQFCTVEGFITAVIDEWPHLFRSHRKLLLFGICFVSYLIGLSMVTEGGAYVFRLFDHYSASGMALLFLIFCECIAFSWCYGIDKFMKDNNKMLGFKLNRWWKYCWLIFCPLVCVSVFIFSTVRYEHVKYKDKTFPMWAHTIGIILALSSVVMIPAYFTYFVVQQFKQRKGNKTFKENIIEILRPSDSNSNSEVDVNEIEMT